MRKYYYTSKKNGLDLTCNICGRVVFLPRVKGHELVNGRLTKEVYSGLESGWTCSNGVDICPECNKKQN